MNNQLIDIGVNLMHRSFDQDRDEVVARAWSAGCNDDAAQGMVRAIQSLHTIVRVGAKGGRLSWILTKAVRWRVPSFTRPLLVLFSPVCRLWTREWLLTPRSLI